jgi:hypothetical protein
MNKLLEQPPGIVETVVRYECPRCGNNCSCGIPYVPKTTRAAEAIRANPEKSDRMIAKEISASQPTVSEARKQVGAGDRSVITSTRTGRDGKSYPAAKPAAKQQQELSTTGQLEAQAYRHLDKIVEALRQMSQQQRLMFRTTALSQMADAYLDNNEIEF